MRHVFHESAVVVSTTSAGLSLLAYADGQFVLTWVGILLACASAIGSWWVAQQAKIHATAREQAALDQVNAREQKWLNAIMDWQIEQIRTGKVTPPRTRRDDVPAFPEDFPPTVETDDV